MPVPVASDSFDADARASAGELLRIEPRLLVERYQGLMRAYLSILNMNGIYRRQMAAIRDHTLQSAQMTDLARKINMTDLGQIADVVVEDCPRLFGAEAAALFLVDHDTRLTSLFRARPLLPSRGPEHLDHDRDRIIPAILATFRDPVAVTDPDDAVLRLGAAFRPVPEDMELLARGALLCPLLIGTAVPEIIPVGVIVFSGKPGGFTRVDVDLATMVAEMVAASINAARLLHRMSILAETDGLTGLANHRTFQQSLDLVLARERRYGEPVSLALLDIDHFKSVNDRYGHQFGDSVLREVATIIKASVRDVDTAARYGGEEFAVIMPNTNLAGAALTIERIRQRIERNPMASGGQEMTIRVSAGVAQHRPDHNKNDLIHRADQALYRAKNNGRNRVETDQSAE